MHADAGQRMVIDTISDIETSLYLGRECQACHSVAALLPYIYISRSFRSFVPFSLPTLPCISHQQFNSQHLETPIYPAISSHTQENNNNNNNNNNKRKNALTHSHPIRPSLGSNNCIRHIHHLPKRQPPPNLLHRRALQRELPLHHHLRPRQRHIRPRRPKDARTPRPQLQRRPDRLDHHRQQ